MEKENVRKILSKGGFVMVLIITMIFISASNFTDSELSSLESGICEEVVICKDVIVGVSCVNKTIENCEDICSIEIVTECHEGISEVCEETTTEICNGEEVCSQNGNETICYTEKVCENATKEQCSNVMQEICEDVEKEICERVNCFKEVIEDCEGIIEQKECVTGIICEDNTKEPLLNKTNVSGDELFENSSTSLNVLIENFYNLNNDSEVNESFEFINNITLNAIITNETGSFYWNREIVNEYGNVNESIKVRLKVPNKLKQITDKIDFEEIESNNKEKVKLLKEILKEELKSEYDVVELNPGIDEIKNIKFNNLEIIDDTISLGIEDVNNSNFIQSYAIDPTNLNFTDAVVTVIAKGTELYKCKDWNFTEQECYGEWKLFKTGLVPREEYSFILTANDPAFGEIIATDAVHLDENYSFISNVYEDIKDKDDNWSEVINDSEYVRVTFEENLTNGNVIDVFVRGDGSFEVYIKGDDSNLLGNSGFVDSNGGWKYITLESVNKPTDTFDFKISGSLEFDYIHDAPPNLSSVILNSTFGTNLTTENLTVYTDQDSNTSLKLIYDWKKDGSSIAVLNAPFEGGSNSTFTKNYGSGGNGTGNGGLTWSSSGGYDGKGGYEFNKVDSYITFPDFDYGDDYTITFWFNRSAIANASSFEYIYAHGPFCIYC